MKHTKLFLNGFRNVAVTVVIDSDKVGLAFGKHPQDTLHLAYKSCSNFKTILSIL